MRPLQSVICYLLFFIYFLLGDSVLNLPILFLVLEAFMIASSCSVDAFIACFAYGADKIKIPFSSAVIINVVCSIILGLSLIAGAVLRPFLPNWLTLGISFGVLFFIGLTKLLDSITKSIINKHSTIEKELKFSLFNFKFILNLYANPEKADADKSKTISAKEAASLAAALSLDGMAVGFAASLGNTSVLAVLCASLITDMFAILLGVYIGAKLSRKLRFNLSWVSGVVLIGLAFSKLIT